MALSSLLKLESYKKVCENKDFQCHNALQRD